MPRLTVIIATHNDHEVLPPLLDSVLELADEVVVADAESTDGTVELARVAGAVVVSRPWPSRREQKSHALSLASGDYILDLEPNERIPPELAIEIRSLVNGAPSPAAFRLRFALLALDSTLRFGARLVDRPVRLVRRVGAAYRGASANPRLQANGAIGTLKARGLRLGPGDPRALAQSLAGETDQRARARYREGARWQAWDRLRAPIAFLWHFVFTLGFLDGAAGLEYARQLAHAVGEETRTLRALESELGGSPGRSRLSYALKRLGQAGVVYAATRLLKRPRGRLPPSTAIRRVLVIRADERMGNQLLTTPLLRALRFGLPGAQIHLLAAAKQSVVLASPHVDRIIPFQKRLLFQQPWAFVSLIRDLRRTHYDVVVEAAHWSGFSLTASLLARLTSAPCIVGHDRGDSARFLSHPVQHDPANTNEVRAKLELLKPFRIAPRGLEPETDVGKDTALAEKLIAGLVQRPFAVLNPGARLGNRRWSPNSYASVAKALVARGLTVLVVWGPGEAPLAEAVAAQAGSRVVSAPETDVPMLAALLRLAVLCVSNNSGPMHLAVALQTPTVGVFLSDDAMRWGHLLPYFAAAEPGSEDDVDTVMAACDKLTARTAARMNGT